MICPKCNEEILLGNTCAKCGFEINNTQVQNYNNIYNQNSTQNINDEKSNLAGFLSFLFPEAGIVLYFLNRRTKPNFANSLKIWIIARLLLALIGVILLAIILLPFISIILLGIFVTIFR